MPARSASQAVIASPAAVEVGVLPTGRPLGSESSDQGDHGDTRASRTADDRRPGPPSRGGVTDDRGVLHHVEVNRSVQSVHRPPPELGQGHHGWLARISTVAQPAGQFPSAGGTQAQHRHCGGAGIGDHPHLLPQLPHRFGVSRTLDPDAEREPVEDQPLQRPTPIESVGIGELVVGERCQGNRPISPVGPAIPSPPAPGVDGRPARRSPRPEPRLGGAGPPTPGRLGQGSVGEPLRSVPYTTTTAGPADVAAPPGRPFGCRGDRRSPRPDCAARRRHSIRGRPPAWPPAPPLVVPVVDPGRADRRWPLAALHPDHGR